MIALLLFAAVLLISFATGARILRLLLPARPPARGGRLPLPTLPASEEFVLGAALGLGVLSYLVLALGLARSLHAWALWALLAVLALAGWPEIRRWFRELQSTGRGVLRRRFSVVGILLGLWLIVVGASCLIGALAPVGGADWDGMAYHLAVPKIYLQHHRILSLPWMSHSNFPFATEMLYLLGLGIWNQSLAKLFHFGFGILVALTLYCWAKSAYGKTLGLPAAAIVASVPLMLWEATVPYNDLSFALYCLLALWAWWRRNETEGSTRGWIVLSGVFGGLALGTKALAGFVVVFMVLAILWRRTSDPEEPPHPSAALTLALWLIPAVLVAAPWYVRSFVWTGNPVYPFFYDIFGGRYWSAALAEQYRASQAVFGLGHGIQWLLAAPWTVTMSSRWFFDQPEPRFYNMMVSVIGPLFLGFLPLLLLRAKDDRLMRFLLAFSAVGTVSWFFLSAQTTRYLLPVFPALALGIVGALAAAHRESPRLARVVNAVIGIELVWGLATCLIFIGPQALVVLGGESVESYLPRALSIYPISKQINATLPEDARVMMVGDTRGFYLDRDYLWGPWNNNLITPEQASSPDTLAAALRRLGVTHVLLSPAEQNGILAEQAPAEGLRRSLRELADSGRLRPALSDRGFVVLAVEGG